MSYDSIYYYYVDGGISITFFLHYLFQWILADFVEFSQNNLTIIRRISNFMANYF